MSEVTSSSKGISLLNAALEKGDDFCKKVEIDGRFYCVFKSQGNNILRLGAVDTQKAVDVGRVYIEAIKASMKPVDINSGVRELKASGLVFENGHHQSAKDVKLLPDQADFLLGELTSIQSKLDDLYTKIEKSSDTRFPKKNINSELSGFLVQHPKAEYNKEEVLNAIKDCAKHQVRLECDMVFGDKSKEKETEFDDIFNEEKSINDLIDESKNLLKKHMTAETAWKVMEAIFSSTQYHVVLESSSTSSTPTDEIITETQSSLACEDMDLLKRVTDRDSPMDSSSASATVSYPIRQQTEESSQSVGPNKGESPSIVSTSPSPTVAHSRIDQTPDQASKGYVEQLKLIIGQTDSIKTLDKAAKQKAASNALEKIRNKGTEFDENEKIVIKGAIGQILPGYRPSYGDLDSFYLASILFYLKYMSMD